MSILSIAVEEFLTLGCQGHRSGRRRRQAEGLRVGLAQVRSGGARLRTRRASQDRPQVHLPEGVRAQAPAGGQDVQACV